MGMKFNYIIHKAYKDRTLTVRSFAVMGMN